MTLEQGSEMIIKSLADIDIPTTLTSNVHVATKFPGHVAMIETTVIPAEKEELFGLDAAKAGTGDEGVKLTLGRGQETTGNDWPTTMISSGHVMTAK